MATGTNEVTMLVLKCPQCGGELSVARESDRASCAHCGTGVLIIRDRAGRVEGVQEEGGTTKGEEEKKKIAGCALAGVIVSFLATFLIPIIVFGVLAVIFLVFIFVTIWMAK